MTAFLSLPTDRIESVQIVLRALFGAQPKNIAPLAGGYSPSLTFKFEIAEHHYVLRVMSFEQALPDRQQQVRCLQIAASAGIAPKCHYAEPEIGVVVMDYIAPKPLNQCELWPEKLARLLKSVHALGDAFNPPHQDLFGYMDDLQKRLQAFSLSPLLREYLKTVEEIRGLLKPHLTKTSCHSDFNTNNVLFDGVRLYLIDWEAAGLEDPYFDLGMACTQFMDESPQDSSAEETRFLKTYFAGEPSAFQHAKLTLMKQVAFCYVAMHVLEFAANGGISLANDDIISQGPSLKAWADGYGSGKTGLAGPQEFLAYGSALVRESMTQINGFSLHSICQSL